MNDVASDLEVKQCELKHLSIGNSGQIEGYASLFGIADQGGDVVVRGAFSKSLDALKARGARVKMLWQHDPSAPVGIWEEVREDEKGLFVRGRILTDIDKGKEVAALVRSGAIDGLSIGYRVVRASKRPEGGRCLKEIDIWEVSIVTFPMLAEARVAQKSAPPQTALFRELAEMFQRASEDLAQG